jgi:hypothetical protein
MLDALLGAEHKKDYIICFLLALCHTPVLKSRTEASIRVLRMFNHTHSNNMINK